MLPDADNRRAMPGLLDTLTHQIYLSAPLFILIFLGYAGFVE